MKIGIIGSRTLTENEANYKILRDFLNECAPDYFLIEEIISGGAKGADSLAERWAHENNISCQIFKPDWNKHGKKAGLLRNHDIVNNSNMIIAFWDGKSHGTKYSLNLAKEQKKVTLIYYF